MKQKILITGGTGFIGEYVVRALLGHEMYLMVRDIPQKKIKGVTYLKGDFTNRDTLLNLQLPKLDKILHLGGLYDVNANKLDLYTANVKGTMAMLSLARHVGVDRFIYISSIFASGKYQGEIPAHYINFKEYGWTNYYEETKFLAEEEVHDSSIPHSIIRLPIVVGDSNTGYFKNVNGIYKLLDLMWEHKKLFPFIPFNAENKLHIAPVDYVAQMIALFTDAPFDQEYFNIADPDPLTLSEFTTLVTKKLGINDSFFVRPFGALNALELNKIVVPTAVLPWRCPSVRSYIDVLLKYFVNIKSVIEPSNELVLKTPYFMIYESKITTNYKKIITELGTGRIPPNIYFSVKTNHELEILKILVKLGAGAEVCSGHELYLAKKAGFPMSKVVFDGVAKKKEDLVYAIKNHIFCINLDSLEELYLVDRLAFELGEKVNIAFRINLGIKGQVSSMAEKGLGKFGIDYDEALQAYKEAQKLYNVNPIAIMTHIGSQIISEKPYLKAIDMLEDLFIVLQENGITIDEINFGGGFPSWSLKKVNTFNMAADMLGIKTTLFDADKKTDEEYFRPIWERIIQMVTRTHIKSYAFEPGRSIVSNAGEAFSKVVSVKDGWIILDISTSSIPESMFFAKRSIQPLWKKWHLTKKYSVAGAGLNTADNFAMNKELPVMFPGDYVMIKDAGAYSFSRAARFTVLTPPVYLQRNDGTVECIRRGEKYEDVLLK
jgi:diaminopimelate decarboxylase